MVKSVAYSIATPTVGYLVIECLTIGTLVGVISWYMRYDFLAIVILLLFLASKRELTKITEPRRFEACAAFVGYVAVGHLLLQIMGAVSLGNARILEPLTK